MHFKSENQKLQDEFNDLVSRALKLDPQRPAEYGDLLLVAQAVLDIQLQLEKLR